MIVSNIPRFALAPLPLFPLQILLSRSMDHVARTRPELFQRLGANQKKRFLIDPVNMPFVLMLTPDPRRPSLRAVRRQPHMTFDARIKGTALTLLDMIDGQLDGDALFFTRDLQVDGDTEAVVCLRNALDDLDGSIADEVATMAGAPGKKIIAWLRRIPRRQMNSA